ncbi:MAG: FAD-binding protein [Burkholderiales bacterium]|nr:FAD-binding protein [Burkholderiales bacterium]
MTHVRRRSTDILILGSGGAGLFAALHAHQAAPSLDITIAVKGLLGKCGCTRMVQGGYNVALAKEDSVERHFMDTIDGSKWLADQDLAWTLVEQAVVRIHELENELGCFFDRNPDGTVHQKAFAGQTFDRTVHKGDLTGIEIINRLAEQVWARGIERLEEHRAIELVRTADGSALAGVLMIDMRDGAFVFVQAKAVLLATGGGPTMYKYHTPSGDKSCDGMAMALRAGLPLRDMEMVQFHPTGVLAGAGTRITGTIIEEGLRGAGGYLLGGDRERFMHKYDPRNERATRDIVSRAMMTEMRAGNTTPNGGLYISMGHLGPENVRRQFKGMVERCADCGFDLAGGLVEVVPTAHYMMGGVQFAVDCRTALTGLFAAGEDTGGVHGANRLGGNGVANSTVFGGIAGDSMAAWVKAEGVLRAPDEAVIERAVAAAEAPFARSGGDLEAIRERLHDVMWNDVGILRNAAGLARGAAELAELDRLLDAAGVADGERAFNLTWHDWLNLRNLVTVSRVITQAAIAREDSRGAHYREDFPETGALETSDYTVARLAEGTVRISREPVRFTRVAPGQSLIS